MDLTILRLRNERIDLIVFKEDLDVDLLIARGLSIEGWLIEGGCRAG